MGKDHYDMAISIGINARISYPATACCPSPQPTRIGDVSMRKTKKGSSRCLENGE